MVTSDTGSHEFSSSTKFLPSLLGPSRKSCCVTFRCDIKAVKFFFSHLTFWPSLVTFFLFQQRRATNLSSRDLCSKFYDSWFFWTPCFFKKVQFLPLLSWSRVGSSFMTFHFGASSFVRMGEVLFDGSNWIRKSFSVKLKRWSILLYYGNIPALLNLSDPLWAGFE